MEKIDSIFELEKKLESKGDYLSQIAFLEQYLREGEGIKPEVLASIYESLGKLNYKIGNKKGGFFQKAASSWEIASMLENEDKKNSYYNRRKMLKNAMNDYNLAFKMFKKSDNWSGMWDAVGKKRKLKVQLKEYGNHFRTMMIGMAIIAFILSFLFLSSTITGFVLAPMETRETTYTGLIFALLGIIGMFFILKMWR